MVRSLRVPPQLRRVEVHRPQIARRVALGLVVEVLVPRVTALASGRHRDRAHAVPELDHGNEAVAVRAVPLFCTRIRPRAEGGKRSPPRRREADGDAEARVVERLDDVPREALEAVDIAPWRVPTSEVRGELVARGGERL